MLRTNKQAKKETNRRTRQSYASRRTWAGACAGAIAQEFSGCSCTGAGPATLESVDCANDCPIYGAYWFLLFLAVIAHSMTQVGVIMLFIRLLVIYFVQCSSIVDLWELWQTIGRKRKPCVRSPCDTKECSHSSCISWLFVNVPLLGLAA